MGIIQICNFRLIPGFLVHSHNYTKFRRHIIHTFVRDLKTISLVIFQNQDVLQHPYYPSMQIDRKFLFFLK